MSSENTLYVAVSYSLIVSRAVSLSLHPSHSYTMLASFVIATLAGLATAAPATASKQASVSCPLLHDGRVPSSFALKSFDTTNNIFNPDYVKGNNLNWSQILSFPTGSSSRFDGTTYKPLEVTINNASIFQTQYGFRRAGLLFANDTGNTSSDYGVVTLHWSVKQDTQRPLNLTHEYLNVWHETNDFSADQFQFNTGTKISSNGANKSSWQLLDRNSNLLWSTPINFKDWQNFAVTLDYVKK